MMKSFWMTGILYLISVFNIVYGQSTKYAQPSLSGTFKYVKEGVPDSICIITYPTGWFDSNVNLHVNVDSNNRFSVRLAPINKVLKISIAPYLKDESGNNYFLGEYYSEKNDRVHFDIYKTKKSDSVVFSGLGAAKYNLVNKLVYQKKLFDAKRQSLLLSYDLNKAETLDRALNEYYNLIKDFSKQKRKTLIDARQVEPKIKNLIDNEYANYEHEWAFRIFAMFREFSGHRKAIYTYYVLHKGEFADRKDENSVICPRYIIGLLESIKGDICIMGHTEKADLKVCFEFIKNNYSGLLRERLLGELFLGNYSLTNISNHDPLLYNDLLKSAVKYIQSNDLKTVFIQKFRLQTGTKVYPGRFVDLNGEEFEVKSLLGKVVLIDIWGEGCGGCASFHASFEKNVYPKLRNNKDFVCLSICLDRKKDKWVKGISSGLLSSYDYKNVSTGTLDTQHPFMKYYNVQAMPFIILIDKQQKVVAKLGNDFGVDNLDKLINRELTKN